MPVHPFAVGQPVQLTSRLDYLSKNAASYRITALLPARENSPQYRIRSDAEQHERVATEDSLKPIRSASTDIARR